MRSFSLLLACSVMGVILVDSFVVTTIPWRATGQWAAANGDPHAAAQRRRREHHQLASQANDERPGTVSLVVDTDNADKVTALFAWITRAFQGDPAYNNLVLGLAAIYGDLPPSMQQPVKMAQQALKTRPAEEERVGEGFSVMERQQASLGAMGAAQWTGQWRTRPHALLSVHNLTSVEDWVQTLPRGCKRTIKRALAQNVTVTAHPIGNNVPAPHSTLAHFRCVVQHEVRLLTDKGAYTGDFFDALSEAVSRYMGTTRMTGEIREYRDTETNQILGFAHEVRKGRTIRGQWFYVNDEAAKRYVWFHSVHSLVERAIAAEAVDVVDLGPSGSDAFSELKSKYGFASVDDWPAVADYSGPFWDYERGEPSRVRTSI